LWQVRKPLPFRTILHYLTHSKILCQYDRKAGQGGPNSPQPALCLPLFIPVL